MAGVGKISELLARPQVIAEIVKVLKNGTCEIRIEAGQIIVARVIRETQFKN